MSRSRAIHKGIEISSKTISRSDIETEIALLMERLSELQRRTSSLTDTLRLAGCEQSCGIAFEAEVLLKNALRLLGDAMSYLPAHR